MTRLPTLSSREVIKILRKLGFSKVRQKGSHAFFGHPDGRTTLVPIHKGKDIGRGLFREILKEINLTPEEFMKLRKGKK